MADNPTTAPVSDPNHHGIVKPNILREIYRLMPMFVAALLLLYSDRSGLNVVLFMIGILLLISATSHVMRKTLLPYVDLKKYTDKALESPTSAGMVFLGCAFIVGVMIFSGASLLK